MFQVVEDGMGSSKHNESSPTSVQDSGVSFCRKTQKNMKAPIKKINAGDAIKILPRTRLRNESTSLVITDRDAICNQVLKVASVGKKSLRIVFQRDTYRMEFKSNPSVELIQTTKISENENKI